MASYSEINLVVLKYEQEFTKRSKDIKKNTWFSFPNDYLLHPDFTEINGEEFKWFIWIVSICSKLNLNKIRLNIAHAEKMLSSEQKHLFSMIEKLKGKQIDVACDQMATDMRPERDQNAAASDGIATPTLHYNTLHNITNNTLHTYKQDLVSTSKNEVAPKTNNSKSLIKINHPKELADLLDEKNKHLLFELYGDPEFIKREFFKIQNWLDANPRKNNKTARGWLTFVATWLDKGWSKYQATIPGNKAKASSVDELMSMMGWQ